MTIHYDFNGRTVLVTGAGRGLGAGCVSGFAEAGARVIAVARSGEDLARLKDAAPDVVTWQQDVTSSDFFHRVRNLERLDVLVNNAGMNRPLPMVEVDAETLDAMVSLNVRAAFLTAQAAVQVMLRQREPSGGSIVHMSSQMGHVGSPGRTVYCMTKHALEGLSKAMAVELGPQQIRVNTVAPTFVETDLTRPMLSNPDFSAFAQSMIPMGHLGQIEDVVNAVLFLASGQSAMTTGHSLLVDGGWTAH